MRSTSSIKSNLFMHEYGHTIQSKKWGLGYLPVPALLSIISCTVDVNNHEKYWTEVDANKYSNEYFRENKIQF